MNSFNFSDMVVVRNINVFKQGGNFDLSHVTLTVFLSLTSSNLGTQTDNTRNKKYISERVLTGKTLSSQVLERA